MFNLNKNSLKKIFSILSIIFYVFFTISFSVIFISSIFRDGCVFYKLNHLYSFILMIIMLFFWYYLYKIICIVFKKISNKNKIILYIFTFLVIIFIFIFLFFVLDIPLGWDYEVIFDQAKSKVLTGNRGNLYPEYLQYFPNNIPLYLTEVILFKIVYLFKITSFMKVAEIFNGILIFMAILFTFLYCKKKLGEEKGYFSLLVCISFIPMFLYLPIFYSDTFSIMFGPLLLYIYSFIDLLKNKRLKNILLLLLFSVVAFIGVKMKLTILFIIFGIIVDCIMNGNKKKVILIMSSFIIVYVSCNFVLNKVTFNHYKVNDFGSIPKTHWIMMGIEDPNVNNKKRNAYGGYNENDYEITKSCKTGKESTLRHKKEIIKRIKKYNFLELLDYFDKKLVNTWGDGSYYSSIKLGINGYNKNSQIKKIITGKDQNQILIYFEQGIQLAFLFILLFSGLYSLKKRDYNNLILHFPILMIMAFLLIWETRSRYLYNYIPLFVIVVVSYIDKIKLKKQD